MLAKHWTKEWARIETLPMTLPVLSKLLGERGGTIEPATDPATTKVSDPKGKGAFRLAKTAFKRVLNDLTADGYEATIIFQISLF